MGNVNYDKVYSEYSIDYIRWIKSVATWKASILCDLVDDNPRGSLLEIGTGRGDALDSMICFETKTGADISEEALKQHHELYPKHKLVKIDADEKLPFNDKEFDCVLLCDILEHVDKPEELLKEASRVGKYLLLKIPIEKAFFLQMMNKIRGIKYDKTHPSGHLHCWSTKDIKLILRKNNLTEIQTRLEPIPIDLLYQKFWLKIFIYKMCLFFDIFFKTTFFNCNLLGASYFAIAK